MKNLFLILALLFCSSIYYTQEIEPETEKIKKLKLGFSFGLSEVFTEKGDNFPSEARIFGNSGFEIGLLAEYKLRDHLYVQTRTNLSITKVDVAFVQPTDYGYPFKVLPASIDVPVALKIRTENRKYNPYLIIGPELRISVYESSSNTQEFPSRTNFAVNLGIGLDHRTRFFDLAPELRYSYGLTNVSAHPAIPDLRMHKLTLSLSLKD